MPNAYPGGITMSLRERLTPDNPVLTKEMRIRMRGSRAYWIMLGYLGFLSLVMLGMYAGWLNQNHSYGASSSAQLGTAIYASIYITQIFLVLFITPAITSGAITIEKEQQTDAMLAMTRLPTRSIIAGKLLSAVAFTALLLLTSLPLVSLCFTMGSVDPMMVLNSYLMMLAGSIFVGALGLMWSSIAKTTTQAVMYTYLSTAGACVVVGTGAGLSQMGAGGYSIANLGIAIGQSWFGGRVNDGLSVSSSGFIVLCLVLGLIMSAVAMSRMETWPERRGGLLRGLTTLAVGLQLLAVNRWWIHTWTARNSINNTSYYEIQSPLAALALPAALLLILATIFCTGEFAPHELRNIKKALRGGWHPAQLKRGAVASGTPFMVLLTLFSLGVFAASGMLVHVSPIEFIGDALMIVASVYGFGMFCQFLSALLKNRWAAWLFATITLGLLALVPYVAVMNQDRDAGPSVWVNLFYLNPAVLIGTLSSYSWQTLGYGSNAWRIEAGSASCISTLAWLIIAVASHAGTHFVTGLAGKRVAAKAAEATA